MGHHTQGKPSWLEQSRMGRIQGMEEDAPKESRKSRVEVLGQNKGPRIGTCRDQGKASFLWV